jgi:hypothetical protein
MADDCDEEEDEEEEDDSGDDDGCGVVEAEVVSPGVIKL